MQISRLDIFKDKRGKAIGKNVIFSITFKGLSIIISLLLIPLTLNYIDKYNYGIWMTISSVLVWIYYFDIGIGSGLRTKLADAIAKKQSHKAIEYISTAFYFLGGAMIFFVILYISLSTLINWNSIFNVPSSKVTNLNEIMCIVISLTGLSFVLKLIVAIFHALQCSYVNELLNFISNAISFILIYIYTKTIPNGTLFTIVCTFVCIPIIVYAIAVAYVFGHRYIFLRPSLRYVKKSNCKELIGLSGVFFAIQISNLVIYSSTSLLISHFFTPINVTYYSIAYRYYSVAIIIFTLVMNPFWGAITNAYANNDTKWITKAIKNMLYLWIFLSLIILAQLGFSKYVYHFWIGDVFEMPTNMNLCVAVYAIIYNINNIFVSIINGIGKIKLQLYITLIQLIIFFPLSRYISNVLGASGILWTINMLQLITAIMLFIQTKLLLNGNKMKFINL